MTAKEALTCRGCHGEHGSDAPCPRRIACSLLGVLSWREVDRDEANRLFDGSRGIIGFLTVAVEGRMKEMV